MRALLISTTLALAGWLAAPAAAQTGSGEFCLKSNDGQAKCDYRSMAQCEEARSANPTVQCVPRFQAGGTTGSGAASPSTGELPNPPPHRQVPPPAPPQ